MTDEPYIKHKHPILRILALLWGMLLYVQLLHAQIPNVLKRLPGSTSSSRSSNSKTQSKGGDSLSFQHRDDLADSITISFRYLDSLKTDWLDSSIDDFNRFF